MYTDKCKRNLPNSRYQGNPKSRSGRHAPPGRPIHSFARSKSFDGRLGETSLPQKTNRVFPVPRSIHPILFARKIDIVRFASRSETIATMPMPMLKT